MIEDTLGLIGTTVAEKYGVQQVVGEGGFAVVYRAEHLLWKRPVALKVFKALAGLPVDVRKELTENFIQEGALLAELSEKSVAICQARDVGVLNTPGGSALPYMVLEWLQGESLEDALEKEQLKEEPTRTLEETIRLLEPVAEALALAHARGIAHRDVKPANMFLLAPARSDRCPVKLLDFGIAKVVNDMQAAGGAFNKTSGALTSFTPAYGAPEQFARSHGPTGPWTDVFAFALVCVELLTGKPPLEGDSLIQLGFASGDPTRRPSPRTKGAVVSDAVEAVFQKALAVAPDQRYPSADVFWQELRVAAGLPAVTPFEKRGNVARGASMSVSAASLVGQDAIDAFGRTAAIETKPRVGVGAATAPVAAPARPTRWLPLAGAGSLLAIGGIAFAFLGGHGSGSSRAPPPISAASVASSIPATVPSGVAAAGVPGAGPCPSGMVYIPGGPFFMGSDEGFASEKPAHKVEVRPYCMDVYEVTTARYITCSDAGWCKRAATTNAGEGWPSPDQEAYDKLCNERDPVGRAQHPINCVTWEMANVFCVSMKLRLPTEAEWEFAARGSDGRAYPWGDAPPSSRYLNACGSECAEWGKQAKVAPLKPMYDDDDHWPNTAPVGSFPEGRSKFGVLDLAGNVWEWVSDWYGPYAAGDGVHAAMGPTGPDKGAKKVIRGGAWNGSDASWERPSFRYAADPADRGHGVGFRCAADPHGAAP